MTSTGELLPYPLPAKAEGAAVELPSSYRDSMGVSMAVDLAVTPIHDQPCGFLNSCLLSTQSPCISALLACKHLSTLRIRHLSTLRVLISTMGAFWDQRVVSGITEICAGCGGVMAGIRCRELGPLAGGWR